MPMRRREPALPHRASLVTHRFANVWILSSTAMIHSETVKPVVVVVSMLTLFLTMAGTRCVKGSGGASPSTFNVLFHLL